MEDVWLRNTVAKRDPLLLVSSAIVVAGGCLRVSCSAKDIMASIREDVAT